MTSTPTIDDIATRNVANLAVLMPPGLKDAIKDRADREGSSAMEFARKVLADAVGFELPPAAARTRTSKYATAEEREEAQKAKAKERRELVKELLAQHRAAQAAADGSDD